VKYDLTKPCRDCPFLDEKLGMFFSSGDRAQDIADAVRIGTFPCHKTAVWDEDSDGESVQVIRPATQACAGALIALEHGDEPNQMMRIAERLGFYDPSKLEMDSPSCSDLDEWVNWHHERDEEIGAGETESIA
jgi:hypothetical protein